MIKDLQARQGNIELTAEVVSVSESRSISKPGFSGRVATAVLKDETGQIKLSLWNDQIDQVSEGAKVKITKGYVSEWQGELQLSTGKFGMLEVLEKGKAPAKKQEEPKQEESEEDFTEEDIL